jgi:hypothetical protein
MWSGDSMKLHKWTAGFVLNILTGCVQLTRLLVGRIQELLGALSEVKHLMAEVAELIAATTRARIETCLEAGLNTAKKALPKYGGEDLIDRVSDEQLQDWIRSLRESDDGSI